MVVNEELTNEKNIPKLLHVEDNYADSYLFSELIKEHIPELEITSCYDGEEALSFMEEQGKDIINLIVLDLNLPKRNGREVLYKLKNDPSVKSVPIVILTTSLLDSDLKYCYGNHANCYLRKPKNLDEYEGVVRRIKEFWLEMVIFPPNKEA